MISLLVVTAALATATQLLGDNEVYNWLLGTSSAGIEALIPIPQLMLIYKNKHTAGVSITMILLWLFGDFAKLQYYISNNSPMQLKMGTCFTGCVDTLIMT